MPNLSQRSIRRLLAARRAALTIQRPVCSVFLGALLCAQALLASDWTTFRGPEGDGSVSSGQAQPATSLNTVWQRQIGSGYSGIAVAGNTLVTCAAQGDQDVVIALNAESGETLWTTPMGPAMIGHGGSLDGAISSPTIAGDTVYAFGPRGAFLALDLATGEERWRRDLATDDAIVPYYGFASSPLVVGDLVLTQVGGEVGALVALERATGATAWTSFSGEVEAQSPKVMTIDGRQQIVFASNEWVAGLDPEEGSVLWRWPFSAQAAFVLTTSPMPIGDGKIFFTPGTNRGLVLDPPQLNADNAVEPPQPEVLWEENLLTRTYSPATVIGDALVGYTSRFLAAYNKTTGERLWRSREPGDGFLIGVDNQMIVVTKAGSLHLADFDPEAYQELDSLDLFSEIVWTPPSYAGDAVYIRSMTEIARVDLVRQPANTRLTSDDSARVREGGSVPVPAVLAGLLEGPAAELDQRVDRFLNGKTTPILDDDRALFLWRGEAEDVGIAGDFLGMRREGEFKRLGDSDLFWYETSVAPRMQYSYTLYVDYEAVLDPMNPGRRVSSVMGPNANWTRALVDMSYFAMPDWPGPPAHLRDDAPTPDVTGTLSKVTIDYGDALPDGLPAPVLERLAQPLDVWLPAGYEDSDQRYPTLYLHEWPGVRDARAGAWIETLNATAGSLYEAPIVVFVRPAPRAVPFAPVVASVDKALRTRADRGSRANIGWAFNGLNAMGTTAQNIDLFGKVGVQSLHGFSDDVTTLVNMVPAPTSERPFTAYLEWGTLDTRSPSEGWDMRATARGVYEGLRAKGATVHGGEVEATSDWKSWRNRTHVMLAALFPL